MERIRGHSEIIVFANDWEDFTSSIVCSRNCHNIGGACVSIEKKLKSMCISKLKSTCLNIFFCYCLVFDRIDSISDQFLLKFSTHSQIHNSKIILKCKKNFVNFSSNLLNNMYVSETVQNTAICHSPTITSTRYSRSLSISTSCSFRSKCSPNYHSFLSDET